MNSRAWRELLESNWISRLPEPAEKARIGRSQNGDQFPEWLRLVESGAPELLTHNSFVLLAQWRTQDAALHESYLDERDRDNKQGKHAPLIIVEEQWAARKGATGSATPKQIEYLKKLGVRSQDTLLHSITKQEASELITEVLKLRGEL